MKAEFKYVPVSLDDFEFFINGCTSETSKDDVHTIFYYSGENKLPYAKAITKRYYSDSNEYYVAVYK